MVVLIYSVCNPISANKKNPHILGTNFKKTGNYSSRKTFYSLHTFLECQIFGLNHTLNKASDDPPPNIKLSLQFVFENETDGENVYGCKAQICSAGIVVSCGAWW